MGWIERQLVEASYKIWRLSEKLGEIGEGNTGFFQFLKINSHKYSHSKALK